MYCINKIKQRLKFYKENFMFAKRFIGMPWKTKIILMQTPEHTNIGDSAIVLAELQLFKDFCSDKKIVEVTLSEYYRYKKVLKLLIRKCDIIAAQGGGNMGNVWKKAEDGRRDILNTFDNRIIFLPQTIYYDNTQAGEIYYEESKICYANHSNLILIARESYSYNIMKHSYSNKILLMPDIVLYLSYNASTEHREKIMVCLRKDEEANLSITEKEKIIANIKNEDFYFSDMYSEENILPSNRKRVVMDKLLEFSSAKLVITDRLHGMIFSAITNTPCIVFGNNHHKIVGVYDWIKNFKYVEMLDNVEKLPEAMNRVVNENGSYYNKKFIPYFMSLINEINEV